MVLRRHLVAPIYRIGVFAKRIRTNGKMHTGQRTCAVDSAEGGMRHKPNAGLGTWFRSFPARPGTLWK